MNKTLKRFLKISARPAAVLPLSGTRGLVLVSAWVLALVSIPTSATSTAYHDAVLRNEPFPGVRYASGLTVCDEELRQGRWVGRYWGSSGQIIPEVHLEGSRRSQDMMPVDAFRLQMEGQDLSGTWKWVGATKGEVAKGLLVTVELQSWARPIDVKIHTLLTGGPVMVRWLEIKNIGSKPTAISQVSPWSGMLWQTPDFTESLKSGDSDVYDLGFIDNNKWGHEGDWKFEPVINQTRTIKGDRGKSGWGHPTFLARNNVTGEWFAGSLAWSANWTIHVTSEVDPAPVERSGTADRPANSEARLYFDMGPSTVDPVLRVLDTGESVRTPETHIVCMRSDLDGVTQTLLDHVRTDVLPTPPSPHVFDVEANHRGYIVDHETEAGIDREIDMAAAVGAETFVIDAGWYGQSPNQWYPNVGDWHAGAWLPNDLQPIREYARKKGLQFGLWMEPESVGSASKLLKQHPDWVATRNGHPVTNGRQLDFSNPEVAKWAESEIARVIRAYDLDLFRIDYNTTVEEGGNRVYEGFVENTSWRHVENLYAMFDRLRKQFPKVIFQNCAGGGGRLDWGILQRFDNTELSDWMRLPRGIKVLNGMTWVLPPEILLRTFGTEVPNLAGDGDLDSQMRQVEVALPIFRGISPSLEEMNPLLLAKIRSGVELYKQQLRPILHNSVVYHHTPLTDFSQETPWVVLEYASPDSSRSMATLFRSSSFGDSVYRFVPRGLDVSKSYRLTFKNSGQTVERSGYELASDGIPVKLEAAGTSEMLIFEASVQAR